MKKCLFLFVVGCSLLLNSQSALAAGKKSGGSTSTNGFSTSPGATYDIGWDNWGMATILRELQVTGAIGKPGEMTISWSALSGENADTMAIDPAGNLIVYGEVLLTIAIPADAQFPNGQVEHVMATVALNFGKLTNTIKGGGQTSYFYHQLGYVPVGSLILHKALNFVDLKTGKSEFVPAGGAIEIHHGVEWWNIVEPVHTIQSTNTSPHSLWQVDCFLNFKNSGIKRNIILREYVKRR